ncbi:MAG: LytTR family DNA-binding domain-containing protein [Bacteroidales bacterium]
MIRAIIIEDEEPAREIMKHYLLGHPGVELVAECADGFCGLKKIQELNPDLVFLDIQMPKLTGLELLEVLEEKPEIIFTTAYDEYAIRAFDMNAVDYLLKPFSQERFDAAVNKALDRLSEKKSSSDTISSLQSRRPEGSPLISRIVVRKGTAISFIPVSAIIYLESEDDYVMIWHREGKALKQQTMKFYEENLPENDFARIHRSYIVALEQIEKIEPYGKDTYKAILKNGKSLPVSRSGYKILKEKISF